MNEQRGIGGKRKFYADGQCQILVKANSRTQNGVDWLNVQGEVAKQVNIVSFTIM